MTSKVRRKPQFTYKSPLPGDHTLFTTSLTCIRTTSSSSSTTATTTSSPIPKRTTSSVSGSSGDRHEHTSSKFSFTPSLPLFHPLGPLAMSLPPLDAALYGLPVIQFPEEVEKSYASSKQIPPKSGDDENETSVPTVSSIAAVAAREAKERPSPRKRRSGGGGGSKRKRKDPDDGDATYPAKRSRAPRGAHGHTADDDSALENAEAAIPDSYSDLAESLARRTTRSNIKTKRQGSSSSDTASVTGTPVNAVVETGVEDVAPPVEPPNPEPKIDTLKGRGDADEREEGELSEDGGQ